MGEAVSQKKAAHAVGSFVMLRSKQEQVETLLTEVERHYSLQESTNPVEILSEYSPAACPAASVM